MANMLSNQVRKRGSATDSEMTSPMVRVLLERQVLIHGPHRPLHFGDGGRRIQRASHQNMDPLGGILQDGEICLKTRRRIQAAIARIGDHAHNLRTSLVIGVELQLLTQRILAGKKPPRHGFIDERNGE